MLLGATDLSQICVQGNRCRYALYCLFNLDFWAQRYTKRNAGTEPPASRPVSDLRSDPRSFARRPTDPPAGTFPLTSVPVYMKLRSFAVPARRGRPGVALSRGGLGRKISSACAIVVMHLYGKSLETHGGRNDV